MSSSHCFLDPVIIPAVRGATVLDVACGYGRWGCLLHSNYWETSGGAVLEVDGFDAFPQNVALCQSKGVYRRVFQHQLPAPLTGAWDTVLACEILEHLEGDDVAPVLEQLERLATLRVICTAPNWPYFREGGQTRVGYNPFEGGKQAVAECWRNLCAVGAEPIAQLTCRDHTKTSFVSELEARQDSWRRVAALAAQTGVPALAMAGTLSYYDMIRRDTLFTNVALTANNDPWWEGLESGTDRKSVV